MNPWLGALGGAASGFGATYNKLADEQRAFRIDQIKADAQYNRQLNLSRAQKDMEHSGVLDENGMPLTREELRQVPQDKREALYNPFEQAGEAQKIKERDQPSQYMTRDRVILTKGELADHLKQGGSISDLVSVNAQTRQDKLDDQASAISQQEKLLGERERIGDERQRDNLEYQAKKQKENLELAESKMEANKKKEEDKIVAKSWEEKKSLLNKGIAAAEKVVDAEFKENYGNEDMPEITGSKAQDRKLYREGMRMDQIVEWAQALPPAEFKKAEEMYPTLRNQMDIAATVRDIQDSHKGKSWDVIEGALAKNNVDTETIRLIKLYAQTHGGLSKGKKEIDGGYVDTWIVK